MKAHTFGQSGEVIAVKFLRQQGYRILERNFRTKCGEIDIIARKKNQLVFIEVKTRSSSNFGLPEEAVTEKKLFHLRRCVEFYLLKKKLKVSYRLEILSILWGTPPVCRIIPVD